MFWKGMCMMKFRNRKSLGVASLATACLVALSACGGADGGAEAGGKDKIYLAMSYSGNNWQDEAGNLAMAVATSATYKDRYELKKLISGTDVQDQIADYQSMIAEGAKLIVSFPISPTALIPVVREGCERGVTFVFYDAVVHEPCAWSVSFITGALPDEPEKAFFGAQTAQALVDMIGGKGKIFMNRGVPGTSTDNIHYETAMSVFERYPDVEIVAEFYGKWDSAISQQETAKAIAAHPDVAGVWSQDGEVGVVKALQARGIEIPVTGESGNGFRQELSEGWPGVSSGAPPAQAGVAMKMGLKILEDGPDSVPKNIAMPVPWVTTDTAKACPGKEFVDGCNFFPKESDTFVTEIFEKDLLPESSLTAATTGGGIGEVTPLPDLTPWEQPPWRRIYTRGVCDDGWAEGVVESNQEPAGLRGCVED